MVGLSSVGANGEVSDESGTIQRQGTQLNQFQMVRCIGKLERRTRFLKWAQKDVAAAESDTQLNVHF